MKVVQAPRRAFSMVVTVSRLGMEGGREGRREGGKEKGRERGGGEEGEDNI